MAFRVNIGIPPSSQRRLERQLQSVGEAIGTRAPTGPFARAQNLTSREMRQDVLREQTRLGYTPYSRRATEARFAAPGRRNAEVRLNPRTLQRYLRYPVYGGPFNVDDSGGSPRTGDITNVRGATRRYRVVPVAGSQSARKRIRQNLHRSSGGLLDRIQLIPIGPDSPSATQLIVERPPDGRQRRSRRQQKVLGFAIRSARYPQTFNFHTVATNSARRNYRRILGAAVGVELARLAARHRIRNRSSG